jgi:hypothetical protein
MKKVLISTLVLGSLVAATAQDAGVNAFGNTYVIDPSVKVRAGSFEIGDNSAGMYGVSFGGNRIFQYFTAGADIILSGSNIKEGTQDEPLYGMEGVFRVGYNFNQSGKGLGVFGTWGAYLGMYSTEEPSINGGTRSSTSTLMGSGFGAEVEYVFDNGFSLGARHQSYKLTADKAGIDPEFDATITEGYLGYHW